MLKCLGGSFFFGPSRRLPYSKSSGSVIEAWGSWYGLPVVGLPSTGLRSLRTWDSLLFPLRIRSFLGVRLYFTIPPRRSQRLSGSPRRVQFTPLSSVPEAFASDSTSNSNPNAGPSTSSSSALTSARTWLSSNPHTRTDRTPLHIASPPSHYQRNGNSFEGDPSTESGIFPESARASCHFRQTDIHEHLVPRVAIQLRRMATTDETDPPGTPPHFRCAWQS